MVTHFNKEVYISIIMITFACRLNCSLSKHGWYLLTLVLHFQKVNTIYEKDLK